MSRHRGVTYKGIKIETHQGLNCEASAEAPEGQCFRSTGTHEVVAGLHGKQLALCIDSVKRDIDEGFDPCVDPECEWCPEGRS